MSAPYGLVPDKAQEVLEVVARVPSGMVVTYGDVAEMVGGRGPRFVGNVMSRYAAGLPWWRVLRAGGWPPKGLEAEALDHYRAEGTPMVGGTLEGLRVDLGRARWEPDLSNGWPESGTG
ncbi:MGMT family protein [Dermatophilaceae bacterium Soc4.6]